MSDFPYYDEPTHDQGAVETATRTTAISDAEGRNVIDKLDRIFLLEPNQHPLVTLLTNVGKTYDGKSWKGSSIMKNVSGSYEFKWNEDFYGGRYAKVSGTYGASGSVTVNVSGAGSSSGHIFTVGDIVKNARTGENMRVATIASTTSITVVSAGRSYGTTAAAAGADGDGLYIVGSVSEENASARNINTTRSSEETNYTQIFKTTIGASGTEKAVKLYGPKDIPYQRAKKGTEHALDIERAFWWGEKNATTGSNGHPERSTGGILEFIESSNSYVQDQDGVLTAPDFNTFLREGFTYGSTTKTLFAGGIILQALSEVARGQIRVKPLVSTYGVKISEWVTPFGTINIVHNPLFVEDYAGYAFLLDMQCFAYRYLEGRDTRLLTNIQAPDVDGQLDQFITECGLERKQAARCAMIKGVTA